MLWISASVMVLIASIFNVNNILCMVCDHAFFIGWHNQNFYFAFRGRNFLMMMLIVFLMDVDAKETQAIANTLTYNGCLFTNTPGEHQQIQAVHCSGKRPDIFFD